MQDTAQKYCSVVYSMIASECIKPLHRRAAEWAWPWPRRFTNHLNLPRQSLSPERCGGALLSRGTRELASGVPANTRPPDLSSLCAFLFTLQFFWRPASPI